MSVSKLAFHKRSKMKGKGHTHEPRMSTCGLFRREAGPPSAWSARHAHRIFFHRRERATHMIRRGRSAARVKGERGVQELVRDDLDARRVVKRPLDSHSHR